MPLVSEFYARRRRYAHVFAIGCAILLLVQMELGLRLEKYAVPRVAALTRGASIVHGVLTEDDSGPTTRLLLLDSNLQLQESSSTGGEAGGVLVEETGTTWIYGSRISIMKGGNTLRGEDLRQSWEVRDAVLQPDRGTAWIFGWNAGKVVARRRTAEGWSPEVVVAESGKPTRLVAGVDGQRGPLVAWRESGPRRVRTALFDGERFVPRAEFDSGGSDLWDAAPLKDRVLVASYKREDRTFRAVTLRLQCCPECGLPPPPERISFLDPIFLLGRNVTGLAACSSGERLLLVLTRDTLVQVGAVPAASLLPEPGGRLQAIAAESIWRRLAAAELPILTFFGAVSILFLGTSMFRERSRVLSKAAPLLGGKPYADLLQRAMAQILDILIVMPPTSLVLFEVMSTTWEAAELFDLRFCTLAAVGLVVKAAYHAVMESALGWTFGKKILGLKVLQADGSRASVRGVLLRTALRLVEVEGFLWLLGGLVMVNTQRRQRLGDLLGGTIVVQQRPPPVKGPPAP
jgi:uncharacterized RDD family membrane protein YckC